MPELILIPPGSAEGATIEIIFHGRPATIHWKDEDTLIIDGIARPIVLTEWDADSIGIAFLGQGEDFTALRGADREKVADAITTQFARLREAAAAKRAEQIERIVAEVERQKAAELGRSLSAAERDYVRKLARAHVVGRTD
jgi:hypothetical protein